MLNTTALLVALSATGLMGHKGCGGARMHHARHQQVTCAPVAAAPTCGMTYAQPLMMAAGPRAMAQAPAPSGQATPMMARPMASPSAPVPPAPADTVPPAPSVPPAAEAPAPPAPPTS